MGGWELLAEGRRSLCNHFSSSSSHSNTHTLESRSTVAGTLNSPLGSSHGYATRVLLPDPVPRQATDALLEPPSPLPGTLGILLVGFCFLWPRVRSKESMLVQGSIPCFRVAVPVLLFFYLERERKKKQKKKLFIKKRSIFLGGKKSKKPTKPIKKKNPPCKFGPFKKDKKCTSKPLVPTRSKSVCIFLLQHRGVFVGWLCFSLGGGLELEDSDSQCSFEALENVALVDVIPLF